MNESMYTAWRERIESELGAPSTWDDLGVALGPDVRIGPIHVSAPAESGMHSLRRGGMRYEPCVRSVREFLALREIDPDLPAAAVVRSDRIDARPTGGTAGLNLYVGPAAATGVNALIGHVHRMPADERIGLLVDPLAHVCFGRDPDASPVATSGPGPTRNELLSLARAADAAAGSVDTLAAHEAGAAPATLVAWTLLSLSTWLDRLEPEDLAPGGLVGRIRVVAPVGNRPIVDAAVLTCIRDQCAAIVHAYASENGVSGQIAYPILHAVSAFDAVVRSAAPADDAGNLVRATMQAVAAASAGADILSLLPWDVHREPTPDSLRLSAGIHRLLRYESGLDRTAQPLAGSYAFERIVHAVSEAARDLFVEWSGDITNHGALRARIAERIRTDRAAATDRVRVGIDRYAADTEATLS